MSLFGTQSGLAAIPFPAPGGAKNQHFVFVPANNYANHTARLYRAAKVARAARNWGESFGNRAPVVAI